jgi:hypothetical protein
MIEFVSKSSANVNRFPGQTTHLQWPVIPLHTASSAAHLETTLALKTTVTPPKQATFLTTLNKKTPQVPKSALDPEKTAPWIRTIGLI